MLKTDREKEICKKYSAPNKNSLVQCNICPLRKGLGNYDLGGDRKNKWIIKIIRL